MKKIFVMLLCSLSISGFAQELFPELAGLNLENTHSELKHIEESHQEVAIDLEESKSDDVNEKSESIPEIVLSDVSVVEQPKAVQEDNVFADIDLFADDSEDQEAENDDKNETQQILIYIKAIDSTLLAQRSLSFCRAIVAVNNSLKKPIQLLEFTLTYGEFTPDYRLSRINPKSEQYERLMLVGESCEMMTGIPKVTVNKCVVEGMDESACKEKVIFIPLSE